MFTKEWYKSHAHPKGMIGKKHSDETKLKMKVAIRTMPDNWSEIVRQSKLGKPRSQEVKEKISRTRKERLRLGIIKVDAGPTDSQWLGDKISYRTLHQWIQKQKGRAVLCVECGSMKNVEWANISGKYMRDPNDFKSLCKSCHNKFDRRKK